MKKLIQAWRIWRMKRQQIAWAKKHPEFRQFDPSQTGTGNLCQKPKEQKP